MADTTDSAGSEPGASRFLVAALLLVYLFAVLRTAWLCDDAFIAFRAVDNLVHGHGLVHNPPERVLGFTNPLWALLFTVPFGLGVPAYTAGIALSIVCAVLSAWVVARGSATSVLAALGLSWLALSAGFVDFSTSGLENPLSHLLLGLLYVRLLRDRARAPSITPFFLLGAILMTRLDHVLLAAPAVACEMLRVRRLRTSSAIPGPRNRWLRSALLGLSPWLAWMVFQIVYYGFPYPNTAYAKLNTTIPSSVLAMQGVWYLLDSVVRDPLMPLVIGLALVTALRSRTAAGVATATALVLHIVYLIRVGGDFMAGRFLTAPFFVSVVWLVSAGLARGSVREVSALALVTTVLGWRFATAFQPLPAAGTLPPSGILSERPFYAAHTGLEHNVRVSTYKSYGQWAEGEAYRKRNERVVVRPNVGFSGFAAGPNVHIIDELALTDALLARIPFSDVRSFRIGHFARRPPAGYVETLRDGRNQIADPCLHQYYDVLSKVIRGPLFTMDRWRAIVALNTGQYDDYVRGRCPR